MDMTNTSLCSVQSTVSTGPYPHYCCLFPVGSNAGMRALLLVTAAFYSIPVMSIFSDRPSSVKGNLRFLPLIRASHQTVVSPFLYSVNDLIS